MIVQLISMIRQQFLIDLPLDTLFQVSTIAGLAELLDQASQARPASRRCRARRAFRCRSRSAACG